MAMTPRQIDTYCGKLPKAKRTVQWEGVIVFKVGGKMFAMIVPDDDGKPNELWFKSAPEHYDALSRSRGFKPAPYLARAKWVALDNPKVLTPGQTRAYLARAHSVIAAALPKKTQRELGLLAPVAASGRL
jgi:predicted DNA-binding protein (MmcQ/YjbR family)